MNRHRVSSKLDTPDFLHGKFLPTSGIIFVGTQHHGTGLAEWAVVSRSIGLLKRRTPILPMFSDAILRCLRGFKTAFIR